MDENPSTEAEGFAIDDETGLPNLAGWMAVLRMEERRASRHGGQHALGIVEISPAKGPAALWAADTIVSALRETDVVALVRAGDVRPPRPALRGAPDGRGPCAQPPGGGSGSPGGRGALGGGR